MEPLRTYIVPSVVATILHTGLLLGLYTGFGLFDDDELISVWRPQSITATIIESAERSPRATTLLPTATSGTTIDAATEEADALAARLEAERLAHEQEARDTLERRLRFEKLRRSLFDSARKDDYEQLQIDALTGEANVFVNEIYARVVQSWSRPPSARNAMNTLVLVELYPSGELNSVGIVESSGNSAFDRSAVAAVRKAAPFKVPPDRALFNARFRSFHLRFQPQDLLK